MSKVLKSGDISEEHIHKTVIQWINLHPSIKNLIMHFPNEGKRTWYFGKLLKDLGLKRGVFDLFIAMPRHGFHGAWIELKSKNGKLSCHQRSFMNDMRQQNYYAAVCYSIDEAIEQIKWYCFE
ncbi:VRR-NUC domain-containing protein [Legionella micdadei]|uniref:VRR-NUC domain-containing protein n=1 Tax=Legionella micdadei TaxID=451 RepID=A0A098GHL8_LEGMI|nr:VRR-NUC domain-containing protein [Legionella micdadei]KTD27535.1 VRR-NUC domain protein [Legionella micdadei]CEG60976.1 protein of unknown function [VRR-NUC domain] [Legionella micdadei]SCY69861.1 VRR-NUC domain-containing protein [Legionella micdadei]